MNDYPYTGDPIGEPNHYEPFPYTTFIQPAPAVFTPIDELQLYLNECIGKVGKLRTHDGAIYQNAKIIAIQREFVKFEWMYSGKTEVCYHCGPFTFILDDK